MIIPWLRGIISRQIVPLTWTLILLNFYVFVVTMDTVGSRSQSFINDPKVMTETAQFYYQYKGNTGLPSKDQVGILGSRAFRDVEFLEHADKFPFQGDEVVIRNWKAGLKNFREGFLKRQSSIFGLSWYKREAPTWITYQFMHAGLMHLMSNMFLLLLFGGALEILAGSGVLILIYLLSGAAGGLGFLLLGQGSLAPMIGASGAISGIMAFYAIAETKKRIPYFYFLSPIKGYYGMVWLPTWLIFPLCFVADIASYLGTSSDLGSGVAYTAHIGGMLFGVVAGCFYRLKVSHDLSRSLLGKISNR